ncbi:MAG: NifU family protein [Bacteroidota bacterium]|jgi:Fe-S cluster biogenesis protein NfuA
MSTKSDLFIRVNEALNQVRPYLEADGGGIELIQVTDDSVAEVSLKGACTNCNKSHMTMKAGVEATIRSAVPEIKSVVAVTDKLEVTE